MKNNLYYFLNAFSKLVPSIGLVLRRKWKCLFFQEMNFFKVFSKYKIYLFPKVLKLLIN
jgi:hypothetical protein